MITVDVDGDLGQNGWYTSDINISWTVSDDESDVTILDGCTDEEVTSDTLGDTFICKAESEGGMAEASVTVKRASFDGLPALVQGFVSNAGVTSSMGAKIRAAERADARGNTKARDGSLSAFIAQVEDPDGPNGGRGRSGGLDRHRDRAHELKQADPARRRRPPSSGGGRFLVHEDAPT